MEREELARNILYCGLTHGREHVLKTFGDDLANLIFSSFSDLHRKNVFYEAFVFLIIRMFHRKYPSIEDLYEPSKELTSEDILLYLKATPNFRNDPRLTEFGFEKLRLVLDDFVQILSRQFLIQPDIFRQIKTRLLRNTLPLDE